LLEEVAGAHRSADRPESTHGGVPDKTGFGWFPKVSRGQVWSFELCFVLAESAILPQKTQIFGGLGLVFDSPRLEYIPSPFKSYLSKARSTPRLGLPLFPSTLGQNFTVCVL